MTRVAIYTRVSTTKQDYENQLDDLRKYCEKNMWEIYHIYAEVISGKEAERPAFKQMMYHASQKRFDIVLVWALDRFTREGVHKVWSYISELDHYGVDFRSFKEPYLNTDNKMQRDLLFSVMGILAEQERIRISERTKAGLERARARGVKLGTPFLKEKVKQQIRELHAQGKSYRQINQLVSYYDKGGKQHFVSIASISNVLNEGKKKLSV